jgi:hypothetical protein
VNRQMRYLLVLASILAYIGTHESAVAAAPPRLDWCFEACDGESSCTQPCLFAEGQNPAIEITCGEWDSGPEHDHCNGDGCADECSWWSVGTDVCWWEGQETDCEGYGEFGSCNDQICVPAQGETCSNCAQDCGACPVNPTCANNICEPGETFRTCPLDCDPQAEDYCGNDVCGPEEDGESCPQDCTFSGDWCGGFEECPDGWDCVDEICVWPMEPVYWCCGKGTWYGFDCPYDSSVCAVGQVCAPPKSGMGSGSAPVCQPPWWAQ